MWFVINEMELDGSNSQLNIVVQIDRYSGAFSGDGDWTDTRRYLIAQDNDLSTISSPVIQNLGGAPVFVSGRTRGRRFIE